MIVTFDLSEETRAREAARMREKALHDETSALNAALEKGIAKGLAEGLEEGYKKGVLETISKMKAAGMTDEQIKNILQ